MHFFADANFLCPGENPVMHLFGPLEFEYIRFDIRNFPGVLGALFLREIPTSSGYVSKLCGAWIST